MRKYLRKLKKKQGGEVIRIVFVCTANCCRSPLAEILFEKLLMDQLGSREGIRKKNIVIESAGTKYSGFHIAELSAYLLIHEEGITMERCKIHKGRCIDEIDKPDLILTMTDSHRNHVQVEKPEWQDKVFTLDEFVQSDIGNKGGDINDPIGGPEPEYRKMKNQVKKCLTLLLSEFMDTGLI